MNRWHMDEKTEAELRQRTKERQEQAKEALGDKWICHPAQRPPITKQPERRTLV